MTNCEIATTNGLLSDLASASKSGVEGKKSGWKPTLRNARAAFATDEAHRARALDEAGGFIARKPRDGAEGFLAALGMTDLG